MSKDLMSNFIIAEKMYMVERMVSLNIRTQMRPRMR